MQTFYSQLFSLFLISFLITTTSPTIIITSPAINPFDNSQIPYSYANIGKIPYGKTLTFDLLEDNQINLCSTPTQLKQTKHFTTPTYLLVDNSLGTCSFTTEAINAQELGLKGVIFVSDMVNYYQKIVQVDDGNGRKVHIIVLFIDTMTYRKLHSIKNVHIKVQFETHKSQKVNMTYFLSASGRSNYIFLRQFRPYFQKISEFVNFKPLYLTVKCPNCQVTECIISNDYCTFEMDTYKDDMGEYILKQQIRQWYIWKKYGSSKYFDYMDQFDKMCTANWINSFQCGEEITRQLGLQKVNIEGVPTQIMNQWRIQQVSAGFLSTPEFVINQELYAGSYDPEEVFLTICQSLINEPQECTGSGSLQSNTQIGWMIAAIVLASILTLTLGYFVNKKFISKQLTSDISTRVNELVAKYATQVSEHNKRRKERLRLRLNEEI